MPRFCTLEVESTVLGVPVEDLLEVLPFRDVTPVPLSPAGVRGVIHVRGRILTVIGLRDRLGLGGRDPVGGGAFLVVEAPHSPVCLLVDRIGDVVEVRAPVPESASEGLGEWITGVSWIEGRPMFALDAAKVADVARVVSDPALPGKSE